MPRAHVRGIYRQLSKFERGRIIGLREARLSLREIAYRRNRNPTTVMRCCRTWFDNAQNRRRVGNGRQRGTNEVQDRRLRLMAIRDRFLQLDLWLKSG